MGGNQREAVFSATAARMSAFSAPSSISSPSRRSMARLVLPSRLALKRPEGSSSAAPLAKVVFTALLYVSPVQMIPACDHTGTLPHFHSSTTSGSASLMIARTRASVSPRQSLSSLIFASMSRDAESFPPPSIFFVLVFFISYAPETPCLYRIRQHQLAILVDAEPALVVHRSAFRQRYSRSSDGARWGTPNQRGTSRAYR